MKRWHGFAAGIGAMLIALGCVSASRADLIYSGTSVSGTPELDASANFALSGTTLMITLTNTSPVSADGLATSLSGLYFNLPASGSLAPLSATVAAGSFLVNPTDLVTTDVSNHWGYGLTTKLAHYTSVIEATGRVDDVSFATFGDNSALDGGSYSLVSTNTTDFTQDGFKQHGPETKNSVVFRLTTNPAFSLSAFSSANPTITFQYGTGSGEPLVASGPGIIVPSITLAPEPTKLAALLGLGILGLIGLAWRRRKQAA